MGKINILVVEDEPFIGLSIRQKLEKLGYHVIMVVASGDEAYQVSAERVPDLILMDIHLEGNLDGIQTAKTLWQNFSVPIVFVTGNIELTDSVMLQDSWCYGLVAKPFHNMELETVVASAINRIFFNRYSSESANLAKITYHPIHDWLDQFPDQAKQLPDKKIILQDESRFDAINLFRLLVKSGVNDGEDETGGAPVDMKEFLSQVAFLTWNRILKENSRNRELLLGIDSIDLDERLALPLSIILTETLSNSLQYAFADINEKAVVEIKFGINKNKDKLFLKIRDNGKGFQDSAQYPDTSDQVSNQGKGLGLQIIEGMSCLIGGEIFLNGDHGTTLEVSFPCPHSDKPTS